MERKSTEARAAWILSILFHICVALLLFVSDTPGELPPVEFVEMYWGGSPTLLTNLQSQQPQFEQSADVPSESSVPMNDVELPARKQINQPEEAIHIPTARRVEALEEPSLGNVTKRQVPDDREQRTRKTVTGDREKAANLRGRGNQSAVSTPYSAGGHGIVPGEGVSFDIQWKGKGIRKLLTGELPKYPSGVNIEAQIKLRVKVAPNGSVKSVRPLQKGETRLENAAVKEVRLWKFEPLQSAQPKIDQECTITFNFRLK